jgi:stearoyl-CoA desaturase (Delta-9 desaturase)
MTTFMTVRPPPVPEPKPMIIPGRTIGEQILVRVFVLIPFAALVAAVRIALAVAGGLAAQGPVIGWVADHRRHHAFSRPRGRPALSVAVRHQPGGARAGVLARAHDAPHEEMTP